MARDLQRPKVLGFPETVDEIAARTVAAGVVTMTAVYLATGWLWVLAIILYGFIARVLTGPRLSPLGLIATRVIVPRLGLAERIVPGAPKRFAQSVGATLSGAALLTHLAGSTTLTLALVAMITAAALLEAALGFCLGCVIFRQLIKVGVVPETICVACNDLSTRLAKTSPLQLDRS